MHVTGEFYLCWHRDDRGIANSHECWRECLSGTWEARVDRYNNVHDLRVYLTAPCPSGLMEYVEITALLLRCNAGMVDCITDEAVAIAIARRSQKEEREREQ